MFVKIGKYIPNDETMSVYSYEICDSNGNTLNHPTTDFIRGVYTSSAEEGNMLQSQLRDIPVYGLLGRDESSKERPFLKAVPERFTDEPITISSRNRLYYWVLDASTIIVGGGCHKPPKDLTGKDIKKYQDVKECEDAVVELLKVAEFIEKIVKDEKAIVEDILTDLNEELIEI